MARKVIAADRKVASILRVLQEGRTIDEERRRLGVAVQTMNRFVSAYAKKYPEADKRVKATELPPPPKAEPSATGPGSVSVEAPGPGPSVEARPDTGGSMDRAALDAAVKADGDLDRAAARPSGDAGLIPAPPTAPLSLSTEREDLDVVSGVVNQVNGWACRGILFWFELRAGVRVSPDDLKRIQELFLATPAELAMLKPSSRHLAHKIRELIGSNENVAYVVGGSTLSQGLMDRWRVIGEAVGRAVDKAVAELPPEERKRYEEEKRAAAGGRKA